MGLNAPAAAGAGTNTGMLLVAGGMPWVDPRTNGGALIALGCSAPPALAALVGAAGCKATPAEALPGLNVFAFGLKALTSARRPDGLPLRGTNVLRRRAQSVNLVSRGVSASTRVL